MNNTVQNLENEIWKDVINYEGLYQVSSFGRVKGIQRIIKHKNGRIFLLVEFKT
ncbi:MAG: NUMOD4 domain-containing protein [Nanoarchaeota archaeon]